MVLSFIAPSTRHPSGGVAMVYEFAQAMAQRGHHVHLTHVDFFKGNVSSLADIEWFSFSGDVIHHFAPLPSKPLAIADVTFGFSFEGEMSAHAGQPVVLIQGYKMLSKSLEHYAFRAPCPKICVASWLVDVGRQLGVPERQLVHVPNGLRHEKYCLRKPISGRGPKVSFLFNTHPQKRAQLALQVLGQVKAIVPELEVTAFGAESLERELPEWVTYRVNPPQEDLVDDIYNASRVFLCTSEVEGFGLAAIEAMACGASLVTTDNGGSRDYAFHDRTALVAPVDDIDALVGHVVSLMRDDQLAIRLATTGREFVDHFSWPRSAELLEAFLERYLADPVSYGRPVAGSG